MKKKIISIILVSIMVLGTSTSYAADILSIEATGASIKYEDTEYLDSELTLCEMCTMLVNYFDKSSLSAGPLPICYSNDWITLKVVASGAESKVMAAEFMRSICKAANITVYDSNGDNKLSYSDYLYGLNNFGILDRTYNTYDLITVRDAYKIIDYVINKKVTELNNKIEYSITIENKTNQNLGEYLVRLSMVPDEIIEQFNKHNWRAVISHEEIGKYNETYHSSAIGLCDYSKETIYLSSPSALVHEFGHFIDFASDYGIDGYFFNLGLDELYELEYESYINYRYIDKSIMNTNEYFANYFEDYIYAKTDTNKLSKLRELTPLTYEYFYNLENNGWIEIE